MYANKSAVQKPYIRDMIKYTWRMQPAHAIACFLGRLR